MKTIGLIGGMSWQSSKIYYEYLNKLVVQQMGGSHSAKILMSSVDFAEIEKLTFQDDWEAIGQQMASEATKLQEGGAEIIVLGTNTIHLVGKAISNAIQIPFLHIAEATGKAIQTKGLKRIGLLGTRFTMEKDFYTKILEENFGLEVSIPEEPQRVRLQHIIYDELVKGNFSEESKKECLEIINDLSDRGVEGVILGCTELPILIPEDAVSIPTFDTTMIHSKAAVDFALN